VNERSLGETAVRGASMTLATQGLRILLQMATLVLLARLLTPRDFGLVAMVTAVIGVADLVRDFGLSSAAVQSKDLTDGERTNLFWANLGLGTACTLVVLAAEPLIVRGYGEPRIGPVVLALAGVFVISGANTQFRSDLTRRMRFLALSMSDVAAQATGIVVAVVLALDGAGLWALVAQQLTVAVTALVINVWNVRWLPGLPQRQVSLRRFFRFGGNLFSTQLITYLTKNIDNIALGALYGPVPLAFYGRAYQLLMVPLNQINAPMTNVALPVLSRVQHDDATYQRYVQRAQLVAAYLTTTLFAAAAGLAVPLVDVLFGPRWSAVAPIFAVLAVGGVFRSVAQIAYWVYLSRGKTGEQLRLILWTRPFMIAIILAGLPWGAIGVAVGHSVAYFLFWLVSLITVGRAASVDSRSLLRNARRAILFVSAPVGVVAWTATLLPVPEPVQIVLGLCFGAGYLAATAAVVPVVGQDVRTVIGLLRRGLRRRVGGSTPVRQAR
jgi:polysaccharide transporter, PST family